MGLALVHVLRDIKSVRTSSVLGAIASPPLFLKVPDDRHTVHLIHYVPDKLCRWNPGQPFLDTLKCKFTIVQGHFDLHQHHFGKDEHNYSHWLGLQLEGGIFSLPHLMMRYDEAALSQRRDAAPLRLISWLTFSLPYWLQDFAEALMTHYGNRDPEAADKLHAYLAKHCPRCPSLEFPDVIRDHIVEQIRDWNHEWQPKSLLDLFEGFLTRMPLHRLAHFLDMVLPQLSPMHTRWDDPRKTLLCCHFFRLARTNDVFAQVRLQFLFTSRAFIYMVRISWERQPMLLFSDIHRVDPDLWENTISKWGFQKGTRSSFTSPIMEELTKQSLCLWVLPPPRAKRGSMQCGSKSSLCQLILLGCRRTLQMRSALLPCTKIRLDHMAPFMRCNWASMNTTRLCCASKGSTTLEKLAVLTNLTSSAKCPRRGSA